MKIRPAAAALTLALQAVLAVAETPLPFAGGEPPLRELEFAYLECDRLTAGGYADVETYVRCKQVGDELMQRGFDGDFDRLIAWWQNTVRQQRDALAQAADEYPMP